MSDKPALRVQARARRDAAARAVPSAPLAFRNRLSSGMVVASYRPISSEADPAAFEAAALAAGARLALPFTTDRVGRLRFLLWQPGDAVEAGPFGLTNPSAHLPAAAPAIILTPLLAFDRRGARLGQGAGHYDRAIADWPDAWRIGIAASVQRVAQLPVDPWDVPLHAIATETEWIVA